MKQMSASLPVYLLLALSGGCTDAYSYLVRDHVFANAQTGNMLMLGVKIMDRDHAAALEYLWPILAFALGVFVADLIRYRSREAFIHWRQYALVAEMLVLILVCNLSQQYNELANVLISMVCGIQVETFRAVNGNAIATCMCIGDLRSGVFNLDMFFQTKEFHYLKRSMVYMGVIVAFIVGAMIESLLVDRLAEKALYFSLISLSIAFLLMLRSPRKAHQKA